MLDPQKAQNYNLIRSLTNNRIAQCPGSLCVLSVHEHSSDRADRTPAAQGQTQVDGWLAGS